MKFLNLRILNLLENAGIGATSTFVPLYANALTSSYIIVGAIISGYSLAQALSYAYFGKLSDRLANRTLPIRIGFLLCAASFYSHILAFDGSSLFFIRLLAGISTGIYTGSLIAKSYEGNGKDRVALAGIVSFGSLGWLTGTLGAGILEHLTNNIHMVFLFSGSMFLAGFLVSLKLDNEISKPRLERINFKLNLQAVRPLMHMLMRNKLPYTSVFIRHTGASAVWSIFPIFLSSLGANYFWVGAIYSINALTQFIFMNRFAHLLQHNYYRSIQLGTMLSAVIFIMYFFSQYYLHILPIQIILGLSWSFLYIGSLSYLLDKNSEKATASSLLESTISISAIIGPLIGGIIAEIFDIRAVMIFAFIVNLGAFILSRSYRLIQEEKMRH